MLHQHLDPRGAADLIMVIVIAAAYFVTLLAVLFMLWNRRYPPIKSKNPVLVAFVFLSSALWFTGDIQVNGHAPLKDTPLENCKAIGVWVRVLLGVCMVSSLIALRSYGLYRVFCQNRPYSGIGFYAPFVVASFCLLVYGVVSQILSPDITIDYVDIVDICDYKPGYKASLFALLWSTWLIVAWVNWCIRHIKSSFNESREIAIACLVVFSVLLFSTVLHYTQPKYPLNLKQRILTTSLDHFAAISVWWLLMAVPLYKCLTARQQYLDDWMRKLRQDGLQRAYHVDSATVHGDSTSGGNLSYLHPHHRPYGPTPAGGGKGHAASNGANAEGEFFYRAHDEERGEARGLQKTCPLDSPMHSGKRDGGSHGHKSFSTSSASLVPHPKSPSAMCGNGEPDLAILTCKPSAEISHAHRPLSPVMRQWDKLTSAVSHLAAPSFTANPMPPIPTSPVSPSTQANRQPYTPIVNFPEPVATAPMRLSGLPDSRLDNTYAINNRQII
ncbi:hypothetical protein GGI04_004938 [Coemansia thaxteri]|nr:hypothetical protein GGI04_004938 [Coemansia thaxteri]